MIHNQAHRNEILAQVDKFGADVPVHMRTKVKALIIYTYDIAYSDGALFVMDRWSDFGKSILTQLGKNDD